MRPFRRLDPHKNADVEDLRRVWLDALHALPTAAPRDDPEDLGPWDRETAAWRAYRDAAWVTVKPEQERRR